MGTEIKNDFLRHVTPNQKSAHIICQSIYV